jgi:hypothetical protein
MTVEFYKCSYIDGIIDIFKVEDNIVYNPSIYYKKRNYIFCEDAKLFFSIFPLYKASKLTLEDLIIYRYDFKVYKKYIKEFLESL